MVLLGNYTQAMLRTENYFILLLTTWQSEGYCYQQIFFYPKISPIQNKSIFLVQEMMMMIYCFAQTYVHFSRLIV